MSTKASNFHSIWMTQHNQDFMVVLNEEKIVFYNVETSATEVKAVTKNTTAITYSTNPNYIIYNESKALVVKSFADWKTVFEISLEDLDIDDHGMGSFFV